MKLRIKGNSIRFRLSPKEVDQLCEQGKTEDRCRIGEYTCVYRVVRSEDESLSARMMNGQVQLNVPTEWLNDWRDNEQVGFEGTDPSGLFMLIEKDFQCLQERANEAEEHLYPNPSKT